MGESTTVVFTSKKMIRFILPFAFVIIQICSAAEWGDSGVKLNTKQMACYANKELYGIMTTASAAVSTCADNPGKYPNGKTAGASFCMFDSMGFFNDDKMKIHWGHVRDSAGSFSHFVDECKDFDYGTVDKAVGNFYHCIAAKMVQEAKAEFQAKFNAACPKKMKMIQTFVSNSNMYLGSLFIHIKIFD